MKQAKRYLFPPFAIWLTAALALAAGASVVNGSLDIHLHDTYFVVAHRHIFLGIAAVLTLLALLCKPWMKCCFRPG